MKRNVNANFGLILPWDTLRMAIARMKQPNTKEFTIKGKQISLPNLD